ncbi:MAG: hypothetical protein RLZ98_1400 [Pseudomonadota bacterium]|jgi:D-alanyl-D-alanine carboxypeptidase (penicillin-binding protein 5/6)
MMGISQVVFQYRAESSAWLCRCVSLLTICLLVMAGPARTSWAQSQFASGAKQAILIDAETGSILYQKNADELFAPASMSKLMTLAVVFKAIKAGQLKLTDEFTMSVNAWRTGGAPSRTSAMFVPVNTKASLEDLIRGMIIQSGNDAAICVAEGMAGSESAFAKLMTAEARRIGLETSTFGNATGLAHPDQKMTARELAKLGQFLIREYPDSYKIFSERNFKYRRHNFYNRNPLLFQDLGVDGLKTGYLEKAGYGMVASAIQGKRRLIAVTSGLDSAGDRRDETRKLLEWGFRSIGEFRLFDPGEVVGHARVWGGAAMYVPLAGNENGVTVALPRFPATQKIRAEVIYLKPIKAPVRKGDKVARLRVRSSTSATSEVPLYAMEDVERVGVARRGIDSLLVMALGWLL